MVRVETETEHVQVVIVGAGPAGIGTAIGLAKRRISPILLLDRWNRAGGIPAKYSTEAGGVRTYVACSRGGVMFGQQFSDRLMERFARTEVEIRLESTVLELNATRRALVIVDPRRGRYRVSADAIVLATGAREETIVERGWIAGSRGGRALQTMQILELLTRGKRMLWAQPAVAGSDLIAFATAAKLAAAGAKSVRMIDSSRRPRTSLFARWYFHRWRKPEWHYETSLICAPTRQDSHCGQLRFPDGREVPCDVLIVSGQLVPNAELLVEGGIATRPPAHVPLVSRRGQLSLPGCFAAGNVLGGYHGGVWCYRCGLRVAKEVGRYLKRHREA